MLRLKIENCKKTVLRCVTSTKLQFSMDRVFAGRRTQMLHEHDDTDLQLRQQ